MFLWKREIKLTIMVPENHRFWPIAMLHFFAQRHVFPLHEIRRLCASFKDTSQTMVRKVLVVRWSRWTVITWSRWGWLRQWKASRNRFDSNDTVKILCFFSKNATVNAYHPPNTQCVRSHSSPLKPSSPRLNLAIRPMTSTSQKPRSPAGCPFWGYVFFLKTTFFF